MTLPPNFVELAPDEVVVKYAELLAAADYKHIPARFVRPLKSVTNDLSKHTWIHMDRTIVPLGEYLISRWENNLMQLVVTKEVDEDKSLDAALTEYEERLKAGLRSFNKNKTKKIDGMNDLARKMTLEKLQEAPAYSGKHKILLRVNFLKYKWE
ncbi:MAG: hypothetical protein KIT69_21560, partial [Propionibacteriaceae bacterium]|nr:hypothetical protein [Propionibacteriaceae bacterium]